MTEKAKELGNSPINSIDGEYAADAIRNKYTGLTKREYFAAMAMRGLLSGSCIEFYETTANDAVGYADALLEELSKTE